MTTEPNRYRDRVIPTVPGEPMTEGRLEALRWLWSFDTEGDNVDDANEVRELIAEIDRLRALGTE